MKYDCSKSPNGLPCEHAGNRYYNYGFTSGTAPFCRHPKQKQFLCYIDECPFTREEKRHAAPDSSD